MPDGRASGLARTPCRKEIVAKNFDCVCTSGQNTWREAVVLFEESACPGFLWTNGPGRFVNAENGEVLHRVDVVEVGRRADAAELPLEP